MIVRHPIFVPLISLDSLKGLFVWQNPIGFPIFNDFNGKKM